MSSQKIIKKNEESNLAPTNKDSEYNYSNTNHTISTVEKNFQKNTYENNNVYGKSFYTLQNSIDSINSSEYIFSFDKIKYNGDCVKAYINRTHKEVYDLIKNPPIKNLYEHFGKNENVKLFIDLDYKLSNEKKYSFSYITKTAIKATNNKLKEYGIKKPKYIILSSNTEEKLSAHIIYPEVIFENIYMMKDFILSINCKELKELHIWDSTVYRPGSLRIYGASKINKNNKLILHSTKNYNYVDEYIFFLDTLLRYTNNIGPINYKPIYKKINKPIIKTLVDKINKKNNLANCDYIPLEDIEKYLNLISTNRAKDYEPWVLVGMTLNNCNTDALDLWINWSRKLEKYKDTPDNIYINKWNEFNVYNGGIHHLKKMAKEDNPEKFREIENYTETENFISIEFAKEYLVMDNDNKNDVVRNNLNNFIKNKNIKTLCIKSPYNTGKSTLLKTLNEKYSRILFVTYRKTLTNNILGSFNNFYSYLDKKYKADKLICQIDSFTNLLDTYIDDFNNKFPSYDLVIMDECESTLNHINASILKNSHEIYEILKNIIISSKKLICLDGDLSNRTYDFIKQFGKSLILKNTIKKDKRHFIFRNDKEYFNELIKKDLENKLNLCIVSMSSKVAEFIYNNYKDLYKCCIHTSNSDDLDMEKLKDVNNYWKKYQLIIYSPTIESGVDFNVEGHIDKLYGILSNNSTSQRAFMQMLARCRKIKNNKINILLNDLPYYENSCLYTFSETQNYVISLHKKYLKKIPVFENGVMCINYIYDEYINNLVYSKQEELNKNSSLFVSYLLKLIKEKGHTFEYIDTIINKKLKDKKNDDIFEKIYNAESVDNNNIGVYLNAKIAGIASREDKLIIEKFIFKNIWKIDYFECDINENTNINNKKIVNFDFFKKYAQNTYILNNLRTLLNNTEINIYDEYESNLLINFKKVEFTAKKNMIEDIINILGFNLNNTNILINREIFNKNLEQITFDKKFFGSEQNRILFGFNKKSSKTIKSYMGFLNSILKNWGTEIKSIKKIKKLKSVVTKKIYYKLNLCNPYNEYF